MILIAQVIKPWYNALKGGFQTTRFLRLLRVHYPAHFYSKVNHTGQLTGIAAIGVEYP